MKQKFQLGQRVEPSQYTRARLRFEVAIVVEVGFTEDFRISGNEVVRGGMRYMVCDANGKLWEVYGLEIDASTRDMS